MLRTVVFTALLALVPLNGAAHAVDAKKAAKPAATKPADKMAGHDMAAAAPAPDDQALIKSAMSAAPAAVAAQAAIVKVGPKGEMSELRKERQQELDNVDEYERVRKKCVGKR
jgi:hypothetical protein